MGRRTLAIGLALLIEAFLLLLLLSLSFEKQVGEKDGGIKVVDLTDSVASEEKPEPDAPEPEQAAEERPAPEPPTTEKTLPSPSAGPLPPRPAERRAEPAAPPVLPVPGPPPPSAAPPQDAARPSSSPRRTYGPPNTGRPSAFRDSERVGTAPNGEPLYAAEWYREPRPNDLRGYLSIARPPGWGLIACRTVAEYRVEDCVAIAEYPEGSQINRALVAAEVEYRVRPPRLGGRPLVGSWVRIRIDYGLEGIRGR